MDDLSEHFSRSEFESPDTHECNMSLDFISELERFRSFCGGFPVNISQGGGYRTLKYNEEIRKCEEKHPDGRKHGNFHGARCPQCSGRGVQRSAKNSRHMKGTEADITITGICPDRVADLAEEFGFRNIGRYNTFTHVGIGGKPGKTARWDMRTKKKKKGGKK